MPLLFARFPFQYSRWLFPPMEYYKLSRFGAFIHRGIATVVVTGVGVSATYDFIKAVLALLLP